jgi:hypothetical protein
MEKPLDIGNTIYESIAAYMNDKTIDYSQFIQDGDKLTEEERTARILEIVRDNLEVIWPLFLIRAKR